MKTTKLFKSFFYFSFFILIMSCSKDDDLNINHSDALIGVWQLEEISDDNLDCKTIITLTFNADNTGSKIDRVECSSGEITSSIISLEWSTDNSLLTLVSDNSQILDSTPCSFDSNEQLILNAFSDFPFNKVE